MSNTRELFTTTVSEDLKKELRMYCIEHKLKIHDFIEVAIKEGLKRKLLHVIKK